MSGINNVTTPNNKNFNLLQHIDYCLFHNHLIVDYCNTGFTAYNAGTTNVGGDSTNSFITNQSYRCTVNTHTTGVYSGIQKTINVDMSKFANGYFSSATSDYVTFVYYITDASKFDYVALKLGTNNTNNYSFQDTPSNGWNTISIKKSDFDSNGTPPTWSNITWLLFELSVKTGVDAYAEFACIDLVCMTRKHPSLDQPCLLQESNGTNYSVVNGYDQYTYGISLAGDTAGTPSMLKPLLTILNLEGDVYYTKLTPHIWKNFYCKSYQMFKTAGYSAGISWWVDSDNWIATYVYANLLYLDVKIAGVTTQYNIACGTNAKDTHFVLKLWKDDGFIHSHFNGAIHSFIDVEDVFTSKLGGIYLTVPGNVISGHYHQIEVSQEPTIFAETGYSTT